jgi:hypothetical protein
LNATETLAGKLQGTGGIAVDQSSDSVYVTDNEEVSPGQRQWILDKFNAAGEPAPFSSTGKSWLPLDIDGTGALIEVDNYGPNKGRIYVLGFSAQGFPGSRTLTAYNPTGEFLWTINEGLEGACGLAVDMQGHPWIGRNRANFETALEFAASGSPPTKIGSLGAFTSEISPCDLRFDAEGSIFTRDFTGLIEKYEGEEWRELGSRRAEYFTIDQSSANGHIYTLDGRGFPPKISEYAPDGTLLASGGEGLLQGIRGIAYNNSLNRIYVLNDLPEESKQVTAFDYRSGIVPDVAVDSATATGPTTAHFSGTVNPGGVSNSWHFEWKRHSEAWAEAQSSLGESLPADESSHEVSYDATGLTSGEIYDVRLVALNTGLGLTATSAERSFSGVGVRVTTIPAAPRTDTGARLNARIDPAANPATYSFEYSLDGSAWTALPQRSAPQSSTGEVVGEELTGLQPDTTYHYRVSAESALGPASPQAAELTFATRTSAEMSSPRRGNELVNTPDKGNQNVSVFFDSSPVSTDGERAVWNVSGGAPGGNSGSGNTFLAERTPSGWRSRALAPPAAQQLGEGVYHYSVSRANPALSAFVALVTPEGTNGTLVRLDDNQGQKILASYGKDGNRGAVGISSVEMSDDGAHIVELGPETSLLEDVGSGSPEVVGLMPDGGPPACGLGREGESFVRRVSEGAGRNWRPGYRRIAATDASRVYFEAKANGQCNGNYGLYERNRESEETILIDAKEPHVIRATPDGRAAYFTTKSKLDSADTNLDTDVYRWEEEAGASVCLTCVVPDARVDDTTGVLVSDDFSHVYFMSRAHLAPGAPEGATSIYSLSGGEIRFVAQGAVDLTRPEQIALSADGTTVLFRAFADRSLTADAVASECPFPGSESLGACSELYRYDDRDGSLECLSCLHGGETTRSLGSPSFNGAIDFKISADGETVAFVTSEALVRADVNDDTDIYEWRHGALRLLTDGISDFGLSEAAPQVQAIDTSGRDVFFTVAQSGLTGFESDSLANFYDARIGGGFEVQSPPAHCSEESCQGPLQGARNQERPASESLAGTGNASEAPRRGRCAAKRGKARQRCLGRRKHKGQSRKHRQNNTEQGGK